VALRIPHSGENSGRDINGAVITSLNHAKRIFFIALVGKRKKMGK